MARLSGHRVLVTGASGLMAFPIIEELAQSNEVYALARFSKPEQIAFDLAESDRRVVEAGQQAPVGARWVYR